MKLQCKFVEDQVMRFQNYKDIGACIVDKLFHFTMFTSKLDCAKTLNMTSNINQDEVVIHVSWLHEEDR